MIKMARKFIKPLIMLLVALLFCPSFCQALEPVKIVLTGGSCSGKTTCLRLLKRHFEEKGYNVECADETATRTFTTFKPVLENMSALDLEIIMTALQLSEETRLVDKLKKRQEENGKKSILFCDRGLIDSKAFVSKEEFKIIADKFKLSEETLATHYNAVFHMTSVAKYNRDFYIETDVRQGDASESVKMDDDILDAYRGHPYRVIIGNYPNMQEKVRKLFCEIESFLSFWFKV